MTEEKKLENPFGTPTKVISVVDENSRSNEQIKELLKHNKIDQENEWYALLVKSDDATTGILIKKGRSRVPTSRRLQCPSHEPAISILDIYEKI